ncbi:8958_t:CDS:2, partial [Cetraspora pellucida]
FTTNSQLEHQIIGSENEPPLNHDNQILKNEINSLQNAFNEEELHEDPMLLYIGLTFDAWEDIDNFIETYEKHKGFSFCRSRNDCHSDRSGIRRHSYEYFHAYIHKAKKSIDITQQCE